MCNIAISPENLANVGCLNSLHYCVRRPPPPPKKKNQNVVRILVIWIVNVILCIWIILNRCKWLAALAALNNCILKFNVEAM